MRKRAQSRTIRGGYEPSPSKIARNGKSGNGPNSSSGM